MEDYMSYGDVARSLNTTLARAKGMLGALEPDLKVGNGRVALFKAESVKAHLYAQNADLIAFLGYLSPTESYDPVVTVDA